MTKAEQFIQDSTRNCHNMIQCFTDSGKPIVTYHHWLLPKEALEAVRIAREEVTDKTAEWLKDFCNEHYIMSYSDSHEVGTDELMEIFKKKMEK